MKSALPPQRVLRMLFWETTIRCNLACAHCRRLESNEAGSADLSTTQGQDLIEQLAELGRRQPQMPVLVFSGGEPLCRGDLFDLVGVARRHGIAAALATNGTLIDEARARRIHAAGILRVSVSLDGATAETHDRMRQIPGAFDRALAGIRCLGEQQVPFQINMTLTKQNAGQLPQVYDLARSLGAVAVHLFMLVPVGCGEVLAETDMLSPQAYEQVMREIVALESRGPIQIKVTCGPHYERIKRQMQGRPLSASGRPSEGVSSGNDALQTSNGKRQTSHETSPAVAPTGHRASKGCLAGLGVLFVSHRGDVYPCGYLPVPCGNILETRLARIWEENEDLARMRDVSLLEGKCGVCGYKHLCGGCRGRAFAATGNYLAEEPFCAYLPRTVKDSTS